MSQKSPIFKFYSVNVLFVLASIVVVAVATLYPFKFFLPTSFSTDDFLASFNHTSSFQDQVNNVLLFMPLGFYCGNLFQRLKVNVILQIIIIFLLSAGLSSTVEVLQIFLPSRTPTPADIFNNTFGGCLGFLVFYLWNYPNLNKICNSRLSNSKIIGLMLAYLSMTLLISFFWQSTINLSNWDVNYPLLLGNENKNDRHWQGYISEVYIMDRAISNYEANQGLNNSDYFKNLGDSLLANYQLQSQCCYQDQTGKSPELVWQGQPKNIPANKGVFLNYSQWLKTAGSAKTINQRISENSEFTLIATVATANYEQTGPARIISISHNALQRNLTLSQQGSSLDLRLRTPITGENGSDIRMMIPDVFIGNKYQQIIITYARGTVQVYIDKIENFYSFNLLDLIPFNHKLFYYALTFIPLGVGLAILSLVAKNQMLLSGILMGSGILLPSLLLEVILISETPKTLSWKNIFLGVLFTAGTMLIFRLRAEYLKARNYRRSQ